MFTLFLLKYQACGGPASASYLHLPDIVMAAWDIAAHTKQSLELSMRLALKGVGFWQWMKSMIMQLPVLYVGNDCCWLHSCGCCYVHSQSTPHQHISWWKLCDCRQPKTLIMPNMLTNSQHQGALWCITRYICNITRTANHQGVGWMTWCAETFQATLHCLWTCPKQHCSGL